MSVVDASSKLGIDGTVEIDSPDMNIIGNITLMPGTYFDAGKWIYDSCESRSGRDKNRFTIRRYFIPPDINE